VEGFALRNNGRRLVNGLTASIILALPLTSCKTLENRNKSSVKDSLTESPQANSLVHIPLAFTDGRKMLFRSTTLLTDDDTITANWGTNSSDTVRIFTFNLERDKLTAKDAISKESLFTFSVIGKDTSSVIVDFNEAFNEFEASDVERDKDGQAILSSFGYPKPITVHYGAIPGTLKISEEIRGDVLLISQELKLQAPATDKYSDARAISRIDYALYPLKAETTLPVLKIKTPAAQARFMYDETSQIANRVNINYPMVLNMEEGTPPSIKEGVLAGMNYWNKILGKPVFSLAEDHKMPKHFFLRNTVRVVPFAIHGAGSIPQTNPETGLLLQPGYELQFPHQFFDDLKTSTAADTLMSWEAANLTAHELGHVLGLQHNFAFDKDNACISVMCYPKDDLTLGNIIFQGSLILNYDKQAIDFLYGSSKTKVLPNPFEADQRE
jgi:hypothetical protein